MTILKTTPIMTNYFCGYLAIGAFLFAVALAVCCIVGIILFTVFENRYKKFGTIVGKTIDRLWGLAGIACLVLIASILVSAAYTPNYTGRNQYKVLIDDSVSFNEIAEKYEIVGQDGDMYILEDKESVNE